MGDDRRDPATERQCPECGGFVGAYATVVAGVRTIHRWCEECHSRWDVIDDRPSQSKVEDQPCPTKGLF